MKRTKILKVQRIVIWCQKLYLDGWRAVLIICCQIQELSVLKKGVNCVVTHRVVWQWVWRRRITWLSVTTCWKMRRPTWTWREYKDNFVDVLQDLERVVIDTELYNNGPTTSILWVPKSPQGQHATDCVLDRNQLIWPAAWLWFCPRSLGRQNTMWRTQMSWQRKSGRQS